MLRIAQFTSAATAADATVMLGAVPDYAMIISNAGGTNPDLIFWVNDDKYDKWPGTDGNDALKLTGSSGIITQDADGVEKHDGDTEVTASNDQDIFKADGANPDVGQRTQAGIVVKASAQTDSGENIVLAYYSSLSNVPA